MRSRRRKGHKKRHPRAQVPSLNWQLPILPARLQASTFGLWMLNCCVRYGNRWFHPGIITRSIESLFSQNYTEETSMLATFQAYLLSQALDLLVQVRFIPHGTPTPCLSTSSSSRGLTRLLYEILHLGTGFMLRCFQRLSLPDAATRLCRWRDNRSTGGPSIPVLSY
jgi:hypothetical protein